MRDKTSEQVRDDALLVARRKLDEGCTGCAQSYATLAARHGATRRDFLRLGLGAVAAAAMAGTLAHAAATTAEAADYYYDWLCLFGTWYVAERECDWVWVPEIGPVGGWQYECWIASINNTGLSC